MSDPLARSIPLTRRKTFSLVYVENEIGCAKRVELECTSFAEVVQLLRCDHAKRDVEVFVDGEFECRVSHKSDGLRVRTAVED